MILAVAIGCFVFISQSRESQYIEQISASTGSCFLEDGTCLHDRSIPLNVFEWTITGIVFLLGVFLAFLDKTQKILAEHQIKVSSALAEAKANDSFKAYLAGFQDDERKILEAVHEQEGIKQSTLRYRAGLTKSTLSLILGNLEKRGIISRKKTGKTNQIFLQKKF